MKNLLVLLLLIPSLSWGEPIHLECIEREVEYKISVYLDLENKVSFNKNNPDDLEFYYYEIVLEGDDKYIAMEDFITDTEIFASDEDFSSSIKLFRMTGELRWYNGSGENTDTFDCKALEKKF